MNKLKPMKTVEKGWGLEKWYVNNLYCMKELILFKEKGCSFHHHKEKDEIFYCIKGKVLLEVGVVNEEGEHLVAAILEPGDIYRITPYTKHRFIGLEDSLLIESSTHHEDSDSYRCLKGD